MLSSELQDPDYKLRHAGELRAPELPMKRALSTFAEIAERFAPEPQREENEEAGLLEPPSRSAPTAETRRGLPLKALTAAVIVGALIPTTILVALLWQGTMQTRNDGTGAFSAAVEPEIALSSPERIEAKAGEVIDFPLAIDATEKLPSRSVVAVGAMPDGASFSEGRPYGATGWSLRPDEIGELRFRLPNAQSGAFDMRIELLAADGAVLAQSETRLNVTAAPVEADTVSAVESSSFEQSAGVDAPKAHRSFASAEACTFSHGQNRQSRAHQTCSPIPPTRRRIRVGRGRRRSGRVGGDHPPCRHARAPRAVIGNGEGGGKGSKVARRRAG